MGSAETRRVPDGEGKAADLQNRSALPFSRKPLREIADPKEPGAAPACDKVPSGYRATAWISLNTLILPGI
jgi:hypothetical protein